MKASLVIERYRAPLASTVTGESMTMLVPRSDPDTVMLCRRAPVAELAISIRPSMLRATTVTIASTPGDTQFLMRLAGACVIKVNVGVFGIMRTQRTKPVARTIAVALSLACTKTTPPEISSGLVMPPAVPDTSSRHSTAPCCVSAQRTSPVLIPEQAAASSSDRVTLVVKVVCP